jgi:arsenite methyltransferase
MLATLAAVRDRVLDAAAIGPGDDVADISTGSGLLAIAAAERVAPDGDVVAIDVSVDCLEELRGVAKAPNIAYQLGAAEALPLPDGSVDAVVVRSVLVFVRDKQEAVREFHRVLRPGGRVSLSEPINRRMQPLADAVDFGPDAALVRDWQAGRLRRSSPMLDFDERDLERMLVEAGFADVRVEVEDAVLELSPESLLTVAAAPGEPPLLERWSAEHGEEAAGRLAARVRASPGPVSLRLPHAFVSARKP